MSAELTSLSRDEALALARFVRDNMDELTAEAMARYASDYDYSKRGGIDEGTAIGWSRQTLNGLAEQLESGQIDTSGHVNVGGDMVIQREEQLYGIDAFMEACLFHARVFAQVAWNKYINDTRALNATLTAIEAFFQQILRANVEDFLDEICQRRALSRTWSLGRPASAPAANHERRQAEGEGEVADADEAPSATLSALTPHETELARLVAQGRSNAEIASLRGVSESTVKNTLSRMYVKLGLTSRVELAALVIKCAPELSAE